MSLRNYYRDRSRKLLLKGIISILDPDKIARQPILTSLLEAKRYAKGKLLDVGCGDKPYEPIFSDVVEIYVGIDLKRFESSSGSERGAFVRGSALKLPFKSESFDTVLSTQVLEHVPEPKKMLEEIYRVLKKDGYLILTAPMTGGLHEIPHDYYRFTKYGLKYLIEEVGFKITYIKALTTFWGVIGWRISSWIYYFNGKPGNLISDIVKRVLCAFVQGIFILLDKFSKNESETVGYILVARKVKK